MDRFFRKSSLIFGCISLFMYAGTDQEFFLRGNSLYAAKEYSAALQEYEMIAQKGRAVLYNSGNCYFHKKNFSQALVCWSRAQQGATAKELLNIKHNKEQLCKEIGIHNKDNYKSSFELFCSLVTSCVSLFFLQILFLAFLWLLVFFLYKPNRLRKKVTYMLFAILIVISIFLGFLYVKQHRVIGVVMDKQVSLLVGPDKALQSLLVINYADFVDIKGERQGWYKVRYSGTIGWVEAEVIQIV